MELKRLLNSAEDDDMAASRPHKRQSPSSGRLPSSPDAYQTSCPTKPARDMGNLYSYFRDQSPPSSPEPDAGQVRQSVEDDNYTYREVPAVPEDLTISGQPPQTEDLDLARDFMIEDSQPTAEDPNGHSHQEQPKLIDPSLLAASTQGDQDVNLTDLDPQQRQEWYYRQWTGVEIQLKDLAAPRLCKQYPDLASEILSAYLNHITVIAKIWSNYDSAIGLFFCERTRYNDCGKLYLTRNQRRRLNTLSPESYQLLNIRLEIGTPFRTLFWLALTSKLAEDGENLELHGVGDAVDDVNGPHPLLKKLVARGAQRIYQDGLMGEQTGLTLRDLDEIAKEFVYLPKTGAAKDYAWKTFSDWPED